MQCKRISVVFSDLFELRADAVPQGCSPETGLSHHCGNHHQLRWLQIAGALKVDEDVMALLQWRYSMC
jgi:hypothetical protein